MTLPQLLPLLSAIFVLGLGLFILSRKLRSSLHVVFFFLAVSVSVWLLGTYKMFTSITDEQVIWWDRSIYIGVIFIPALFYHFSVLFTKQKSRYQKQSVVLAYVISLFFLIMSRTPYFVDGVFYYEWGVHTKAGPLHHVFLLYFTFFIAFLFYNVYRFYRQTNSGLARAQARYVLLAFACLVFIGTWGFAPAYGLSIYPFAYISGLFFTSILAYSIVKHRFMDIRLIIKKSTVFFSSLLVTMGISYFIYSILSWNFPKVDYWQVLALFLGLIILQPIRNFFTNIANRYFFADIYDYQEVLRDLSHHLTAIIDLAEVVDSIINTINESFKLEKSGLILCKHTKSGIDCEVMKATGFAAKQLERLAGNSFLIRYLSLSRTALLADEIPIVINSILDKTSVKNLQTIGKVMEEIGAKVCSPMLKEGKLIGLIILGRKLSKEGFSNEDLELIDTLSNQASVAIDNAQLYQQVKDFNIKLKQEVKEATTDLKRINRKLQYANANLQQLDKAKSEFLSIASHQLRTPLSGIKGYLSMLIEGDFGKIPRQVNNVIKELYQNTDRMTRLINTFLNISRIEANRLQINKTEFNMVDLVKDVFSDFKLEASKRHIKYSSILPKAKLMVSADSDKIKDVLINFIDNAMKYTPEGFVKVVVKSSAKQVRVEVQDSGIGVRKSDLDRLFGKFARGTGIAKINTGGSGLGLYIAKKIIEAHGGKVYIQSTGKDKGSVFGFSLPLANKQ